MPTPRKKKIIGIGTTLNLSSKLGLLHPLELQSRVHFQECACSKIRDDFLHSIYMVEENRRADRLFLPEMQTCSFCFSKACLADQTIESSLNQDWDPYSQWKLDSYEKKKAQERLALRPSLKHKAVEVRARCCYCMVLFSGILIKNA